MTEGFEVTVIGAGQAGLSVGYYLKTHRVNFVILDKNERVGDSWRLRYDALKLFTPSEYDGLPGKAFPRELGYLPKKDEFANFLEDYAKKNDFAIHSRVRADSITSENGSFVITTDSGNYQTRQVVIATGAYQTPSLPAFSKSLPNIVYQIHSIYYRNPSHVPEGDVLVVGTATSGLEIALDLAQSRKVYLSGRKMPKGPRWILGKDVFWWADKLGFLFNSRVDSFIGRRRYKGSINHGDSVFADTMEKVMKNQRIIRVPRVKTIENEKIVLDDGTTLEIQNIIWATGFRNDYSWIKLDIVDEEGWPIHKRGVVESVPGLYFIGLRWLYRENSSMIAGVGTDAKYLSSVIVRRSLQLEPLHSPSPPPLVSNEKI